MPESITLIERAAALLRERDRGRVVVPERAKPDEPPPAAIERDRLPPAPVKVLDLGVLARRGIALPSERRSRTVEEFRLIKQNLITASQQDAQAGLPSNRLIMIASSLPGEGKTFVAVNLALAFASATDHSALLVDTDIAHPMLPSLFGFEAEQGIVDVLAGRAQLPDVVLGTSLPGLMVLPAGPPGGPEVPELFSSKRMLALLAELPQRYGNHYIIVDTPPCLATTEASALAPLVAQVVFVVEAHRTQQQEIEAGLRLLSGCPRISLLLNKGDRIASEHFGSYGSHYYSNGNSEERQGVGQA